MIHVPSGTYFIGTDKLIGAIIDREGPKINISLKEFYIDETVVTNIEFLEFCEKTNYVTEAEKFGWSFVFHYFLSEETKKKSKCVGGMAWWYGVEGACWKHPEGPDSNLNNRMDHPVVQVSRNDAVAYCQWANKRLPTEAEWEVAAKGTTNNELYPWGNDFVINENYRANIWQGNFPKENTMEDGFGNTSPAKYYEPNTIGLYQMIGNVWEWCVNPRAIELSCFCKVTGSDFWKNFQNVDDKQYATKGGSFLCHESYCNRYRISARNGNSGMSASNNLGFRCVKDIDI